MWATVVAAALGIWLAPGPAEAGKPATLEARVREVLRYLEAGYVEAPKLRQLAAQGLARALDECEKLTARSEGLQTLVEVAGSKSRKYNFKRGKGSAKALARSLAKTEALFAKHCPARAERFGERLAAGLVAALDDPFSAYFSRKTYRVLRSGAMGEAADVGLTFLPRNENGLTVCSVGRGTSAQLAGLRPGDRVISVAGKPVDGLTPVESIIGLLGAPGTSVEVGLATDGDAVRKVKLLRRRRGRGRIAQRKLSSDVAYLALESFEHDVADSALRALNSMAEDGPLRGVVLDLRGNPGGLLTEGVTLLRAFTEPGPVLLVADRERKAAETYKTEAAGVYAGTTVAVLVDRGTASIAEAVALALREGREAALIGERTYGKGSVQQVLELEAGGALRMTVAHYTSGQGTRVSRNGLKADVEVYPAGEGPVEEALAWIDETEPPVTAQFPE